MDGLLHWLAMHRGNISFTMSKEAGKYLIPTSPWYGEGHQLRSYCICSVVLCLVAE